MTIFNSITSSPGVGIKPKLRLALVGGSLAAYHTNSSGTGASRGVGTYDEDSRGIFNYANMYLGTPFQIVKNAGVAGRTSTQVLANLNTDLAGVSAGYCLIFSGGNDLIAGTPVNTIKSNLTQIYKTILNKGMIPIGFTITPAGGTVPSTAVKGQMQINDWLRDFSVRNPGIKIFDSYYYAINPTAGTDSWRTGWSQDGTHPVMPGADGVGTKLGQWISTELGILTRGGSVASLVDTWTNGGGGSGGDGVNLYEGVSLLQGTSGASANISGTTPCTITGSIAGTASTDKITLYAESLNVASMTCTNSIGADSNGYGNYQQSDLNITSAGQYIAYVFTPVSSKGTSGKWYSSEAVVDIVGGTTRPAEVVIMTSFAGDQSTRSSQGWETVAASAAIPADWTARRMKSPRKQFNGEGVLQTIIRVKFRTTGTCTVKIRQVALREYSAQFD